MEDWKKVVTSLASSPDSYALVTAREANTDVLKMEALQACRTNRSASNETFISQELEAKTNLEFIAMAARASATILGIVQKKITLHSKNFTNSK